MKPRRTPRSNHVYRLEGGTEDNDLWVELARVRDDVLGETTAICSVWELSDEERQAIADGANVELEIIGGLQPPVSLTVTDQELGKG